MSDLFVTTVAYFYGMRGTVTGHGVPSNLSFVFSYLRLFWDGGMAPRVYAGMCACVCACVCACLRLRARWVSRAVPSR